MSLFRAVSRALLPLRSAHGRLRNGLTLGVRALVLAEDGGGVLLVRHGYMPGWYLPGGGVEPGETAAQALARELAEETGIAPDGPPAFVGLYFNSRMANRDHVALYRVDTWRRVAAFVPTAEIREAAFFRFDALPDDVSAATRRRLAEHLAGTPADDVW